MPRVPQARFLNLEYIFNHLFDWLGPLLKELLYLISHLSSLFWISLLISVLSFVGIVILILRISRIHSKRTLRLAQPAIKEAIPEDRKNKWAEIQKKIGSENSADWKEAIIEIDSIIDSILRKIGYSGENMEEMLKIIEPSDFENIQNVWEAHQVRKKIDAEGERFVLTKEIVKETVDKYQKALKEFKYI